ncbi:MAG: ABC transporter substrate-binding protein [Chloroflexota bacterium]
MSDGEVTAGAALSLSGRFAVQGEQQRGRELWAEHLDDAGRLVVDPAGPPRPITLRVYDDGSTRAGAAAATEHLILKDRVQLLFGPYSSVLLLPPPRSPSDTAGCSEPRRLVGRHPPASSAS